jgi:hypothetical protein
MRAVAYVVGTERLGWPSEESRWAERTGFQQYFREPEVPTATCHLQLAADQAALCGFPWEALVEVPGKVQFPDIDPDLRCSDCEQRGAEAAAGS